MSWKKALVIALAVLLVLVGIPVLLPGMGAGADDCHAVAGAPCDMAVIASSALLVTAVMWFTLRSHRDPSLGVVSVRRLERPPRLA